jgi:hypothetical protein
MSSAYRALRYRKRGDQASGYSLCTTAEGQAGGFEACRAAGKGIAGWSDQRQDRSEHATVVFGMHTGFIRETK